MREGEKKGGELDEQERRVRQIRDHIDDGHAT